MVTFYTDDDTDGTLEGPIVWNLFIGWEDEPGGVPIYKPVSFTDTGEPYVPTVPQSPTLSGTQTSRTTIDLAWQAAPGQSGPPITEWNVERRSSTDGGANFGSWAAISGSPFAAATLTAAQTGLSTGTPEVIFEYRVRGVNGDGVGDWSSTLSFQWNGTVTNPPNRPTNLVATQINPTSVLLSWTPATGAATDGATKHGLWSGNTDLGIDVDKAATSFLWTGLTQGTSYLNINLRRFNSAGWSGGSNWIDFTTPRVRLTVDDPVMGQSVPDGVPAYRTQIPAIRVYNSGDVIPKFNQYQPRVIAFTDDPASNANGTDLGYVDVVETMLEDFYYGSGSSARQNCEMHVANGNEIDRSWTSGSLSQTFINVYAALWDLITQTTGGVRRYPKASVWVDMTANNIRQYGAGPRFKAIAKYLHGQACSYYPAGRTIQASNPLIQYDPASYPPGCIWDGLPRNAYSFYIDPVFTALADWRASGGVGGAPLYGQLDMMACWEVGIPIHHSLDGDNLSNYVRTGANATDLTQKPRYLVGGARVTGPANEQYNMKGFLPYIWEKCDAEDVSMREMLYWNQQSNPQIPNKWETDAGKTSPDSVTAWYSWSPGYRLADI